MEVGYESDRDGHEDVALAERGGKPFAEPGGTRGAVVAPVIDENLA